MEKNELVNNGFEALDYMAHNERFAEPTCQEEQDKREECISVVEKELKALEIIRNHSDLSMLEINKKLFPKEYLLVVGDMGKKVITKEEYDLLKEVLL